MKQKSPYTIEELKKKKNLTHGQKVRLARHSKDITDTTPMPCPDCGATWRMEDFKTGESIECKVCNTAL